MTALIVGFGNLLIGAAYSGLGLLSAWEALSQYRYRGLSRFGLGFSVMAASCGPHHLVHGWHVLHAGSVSVPMLAVTLIGLPAGAVFCWLRLEAMLGGRGDRTIAGLPQGLVLVAVLSLVGIGALAGWSLATPRLSGAAMCTTAGLQYPAGAARAGIDFTSPVVLANLFVTVTYTMAGWYLIETQVRRYITHRLWSLSGMSLACVFPTCAFMHLIHALDLGPHSATLPFDLLGVPASIYFLWTVKRVHGDSVVDWNRRPLVGVAATPDRASPWSGAR